MLAIRRPTPKDAGVTTDTPAVVSEVCEALERPHTWTGLPGYGGTYTWRTEDGVTVTLGEDGALTVRVPPGSES